MGIRTVLIVEADHAAKLTIVAAQMGYGQPFDQGRRLIPSDTQDATPTTPPTHYLVNDASMVTDLEQKFRLMAAGEFMPQVVWADVPGITETSANAAAAALQVISEAGGTISDLPTLLEAKGLRFVPEMEI